MNEETENQEAPPAPESPAPDPLAPDRAAAGEKLAKLEAELAETKDKLLRALAEGENQRRRFTREREESLRYAASSFAKELLSVADNLRRAISSETAISANPAAKGVIEGVGATERELLAIFDRHGVKRVEPALGDPFDPHLHQAMYEIETAEQPPGTVAQALQPGYVMFDRLLRPALVGVAKTPAPAQAKPETKPE
jgi:molecular chaperone GrpE